VFHKAEYRVHCALKSRIFEDGVLIMEKKSRLRKKKSRRSRCPSFALSRLHENASRYSNRRSSMAVEIGICEIHVQRISHELYWYDLSREKFNAVSNSFDIVFREEICFYKRLWW